MRLALLSTGRQDWGILRSTYLLMKPMLIQWKMPKGTACEQSAEAMKSIGQHLEFLKPDALMLVGDRYETLSAALSATVMGIPIIHLHGGETSEGSFDNQIRGAITKLSHLHLASSEQHRRNIIRSGEDPQTVHVVGAPGTDNLFRDDLPSLPKIAANLRVPSIGKPFQIFLVHPVTLGIDVTEDCIRVAREVYVPGCTQLAVMPNNDPGFESVRQKMTAHFPLIVESLEPSVFWGILKHADLLVGNSSALVVEAPSTGVKTILLGDRQKGRTPPLAADGKCAERIQRVILSWAPPKPARKAPLPPLESTLHIG